MACWVGDSFEMQGQKKGLSIELPDLPEETLSAACLGEQEPDSSVDVLHEPYQKKRGPTISRVSRLFSGNAHLDIRCEFFNAFNHLQYGDPEYGAPATPRHCQLRLY